MLNSELHKQKALERSRRKDSTEISTEFAISSALNRHFLLPETVQKSGYQKNAAQKQRPSVIDPAVLNEIIRTIKNEGEDELGTYSKHLLLDRLDDSFKSAVCAEMGINLPKVSDDFNAEHVNNNKTFKALQAAFATQGLRMKAEDKGWYVEEPRWYNYVYLLCVGLPVTYFVPWAFVESEKVLSVNILTFIATAVATGVTYRAGHVHEKKPSFRIKIRAEDADMSDILGYKDEPLALPDQSNDNNEVSNSQTSAIEGAVSAKTPAMP